MGTMQRIIKLFVAGLITTLMLSGSAFAVITFERTYGGSREDMATSVTQTTDGGYILTGFARSYGSGYANAYLIKTDSLGEVLWMNIYSDYTESVGAFVAQTSDGGYIVTGYAGAPNNPWDLYLIKTDSLGSTSWTKTYGGTSGNRHDRGNSVSQTCDGGYIIAGETGSYGAGSSDVWLIKVNSQGDTLWTKTYGGNAEDVGRSVGQTDDEGYIIGGWTKSYGAGSDDFYLIKTDSLGDTLWTRTYGGTSADRGYSVSQTLDGGYIVDILL